MDETPLTPPTPAIPTPKAPITNRSTDEIEYSNLTAYFEKLVKYTYGAILLVLATAGVFLWKSTSDVKIEAATAISATQESANQQISKIGIEATLTAQSAAQKAIDQALEKSNIQQMIERSTKEKVSSAVDKEIERNLAPRIETFKNLTVEIGEISNHGAQLRLGFRSGFDYLVKKANSPDPTVKEYAKATLLQIGADYEERLKVLVPQGENVFLMLGGIGMVEAAKTPKGLMGIIHNSENTNFVTAAFLDLRKMTGMKVQVFDIPAAERWCAENRPKCE